MKNALKPFVLAALAAFVTTANLGATPLADRTPLAIVRFADPNVAFERSLRMAVETAEATRPNVQYTLVSTLPPSSADTMDEARMAQNIADVKRVRDALRECGVPEARIVEKKGFSRSIRAHEVRVFVE